MLFKPPNLNLKECGLAYCISQHRLMETYLFKRRGFVFVLVEATIYAIYTWLPSIYSKLLRIWQYNLRCLSVQYSTVCVCVLMKGKGDYIREVRVCFYYFCMWYCWDQVAKRLVGGCQGRGGGEWGRDPCALGLDSRQNVIMLESLWELLCSMGITACQTVNNLK